MATGRVGKFITLIEGVHKKIQQIKLSAAPFLGVKSVHVFWISDLALHPEGLTSAELAANGKVSRSLVSRELSELQKKGYVLVTAGGGAKRGNYNSRIFLTEKGVSLAKKISAIEKRIQTETRSGISDEEMLAFYRTLEKLNGNLRNISHEML